MDKYITDIQAREAFCNALEKHGGILAVYQGACLEGAFCAQIRDTEAADVVEVVRCKDCKNLYPDDTEKLHWCDCHRMFVGLDDFCNYGKRMDGGD